LFSIQQYGLVKADKEITEGPEVEKWANGFENNTFEETMGLQLLLLTWTPLKIFRLYERDLPKSTR
jgi:hypothetical protein